MPRCVLNPCDQFLTFSGDLPLQLMAGGARNCEGPPGATVSDVGKDETGGGKRALDSDIGVTGCTCPKQISVVGGRAANGGGRKGESRHVTALEG